MTDPKAGERESRSDINHACRHPRDKPCELLVLQRCQFPLRRTRGLMRRNQTSEEGKHQLILRPRPSTMVIAIMS